MFSEKPGAKFRLREPFAAGSHLSGALASVFAACYLASCSSGQVLDLSIIAIYGLALVVLFLSSGLFHGLHVSENTINKLERLDYAAIYLLIAGTYTPLCFFVVKGELGWGLFASQWILAFIGMWLALTRGPGSRGLQVAIYLAMGWAFLLILPSLSAALTPRAFNLLILGGVFYSVGALIFMLNAPAFLKTRLSTHDCWHIFVLLGSAAHYGFVLQIVSEAV